MKVYIENNKKIKVSILERLSLYRKLPMLVFIGVVLPLLMLIIVAIGTSSKGTELTSIEAEISELETQNSALRAKIISETSLTKLSESIDEVEYKRQDNLVYLNKDSSVAQLP